MLSIFLEKFDLKAFTKQVSDVLLSIGKSLFSVIEEIDLASSVNISSYNLVLRGYPFK